MNNSAITTAASIANNLTFGKPMSIMETAAKTAAEASAAIAGYDDIIDVTYTNPFKKIKEIMEVYPPRRMVTYG